MTTDMDSETSPDGYAQNDIERLRTLYSFVQPAVLCVFATARHSRSSKQSLWQKITHS
jgi:hypothetical protein